MAVPVPVHVPVPVRRVDKSKQKKMFIFKSSLDKPLNMKYSSLTGINQRLVRVGDVCLYTMNT